MDYAVIVTYLDKHVHHNSHVNGRDYSLSEHVETFFCLFFLKITLHH